MWGRRCGAGQSGSWNTQEPAKLCSHQQRLPDQNVCVCVCVVPVLARVCVNVCLHVCVCVRAHTCVCGACAYGGGDAKGRLFVGSHLLLREMELRLVLLFLLLFAFQLVELVLFILELDVLLKDDLVA